MCMTGAPLLRAHAVPWVMMQDCAWISQDMYGPRSSFKITKSGSMSIPVASLMLHRLMRKGKADN